MRNLNLRKSIILAGLAVVVIMCLVPPMEVYTINVAAKSEALREFGAQASPVTSLQYIPVWSEAGSGLMRSVERTSLDATRLMLQVVIVALFAGGVAAVVGSE